MVTCGAECGVPVVLGWPVVCASAGLTESAPPRTRVAARTRDLSVDIGGIPFGGLGRWGTHRVDAPGARGKAAGEQGCVVSWMDGPGRPLDLRYQIGRQPWYIGS